MIAAFVNGLTMVAVVGWILIEAVRRLLNPLDVLAGPMMVIAVLGLHGQYRGLCAPACGRQGQSQYPGCRTFMFWVICSAVSLRSLQVP